MSPEVLRIVITGVVGLVTAFILALVNSWISARAGTDETLRAERLNVYPALWRITAAISKWPRVDLTWATSKSFIGSYVAGITTQGVFTSPNWRGRGTATCRS